MILRAPNVLRLIRGKPRTYLSNFSAAASSTLTVESISGFGVGQYLLLGLLGNERSEIVRVHTATPPSGSTITLNANTVYRHEVGAPVILFDYNQVEFSRATTETGGKSVLATNDLTPDSMDTIYDDTTNSTGFGFTRFKNSAASTFSDYSDAIPYAGYSLDATFTILDRALSQASATVTPLLTYDNLFSFMNDFVTIANQENTRWSDAKVLNYELDTIATGDWEFTLPTNIAKNTDPTSIIAVHMTGCQPLRYVAQREWNQMTIDLVTTTNTSAITTGDPTIVLTNSYSFADSGSIQINGDVIAYTGNTRATGTLTGVTGIQAAGHAAAQYVFQAGKFDQSDPVAYTISSAGKLRIWPLASATSNDKILWLDYYRLIPTVDSLGDLTLIRNNEWAINYVSWRIKKHLAGASISTVDPEFQQYLKNLRTGIERDMPSEPIRVSVKPPRRFSLRRRF